MRGAVHLLLVVCAAIAGGAAALDFSVDGGSGEGLRTKAVTVDPRWWFLSSRLQDAYVALQTWKQEAIFSDPKNLTADWVGPEVCNYTGVFCAPLPWDRRVVTVVGVDLNHGDIAGYLPPELGLLADLALLHLNSNRFCGMLLATLRRLWLLHELDLSNNRFMGLFPDVVLRLPTLRFLDLRFNDFEGNMLSKLFGAITGEAHQPAAHVSTLRARVSGRWLGWRGGEKAKVDGAGPGHSGPPMGRAGIARPTTSTCHA